MLALEEPPCGAQGKEFAHMLLERRSGADSDVKAHEKNS